MFSQVSRKIGDPIILFNDDQSKFSNCRYNGHTSNVVRGKRGLIMLSFLRIRRSDNGCAERTSNDFLIREWGFLLA